MSEIGVSSREFTARKPYKCYKCGRTIGKGEQYRRITMTRFPGGSIVYKFHLECYRT